MQGDDPAGGEDPAHVAQPGADHDDPRSRGPGNRFTELGRYEYAWSSPVTRPSSGTMRSNHSEKNVDSGGLVGVVISRITTRPPGRTTRVISASPRSRSEKLRAPKPTVAASNALSSYGSASALACSQRTSALLVRARASMPSEKSEPTTSLPRRASAIARSPVPVATSRARVPGPTRARSAARSRQRWWSPAVMTEFMAS